MNTPTAAAETQCPATYNKGGNVGIYVTHEITHIKHEGQWFEVRDGEFQHIGEHLPFDFISAKYPE